MILEEIRYVLEDIERIEQAIVDRLADEPVQVRDRLNQEHEVAQLLDHMQAQTREALRLYTEAKGERAAETRLVSADAGEDTLAYFYRLCDDTQARHARNPNEDADAPQQRYRKKRKLITTDDGTEVLARNQPTLVDNMFSGEEGYGRYFDLNASYDQYVNLPGVPRTSYLQYLDRFDDFSAATTGLARRDKLTDAYLQYVAGLDTYLTDFMRKTRPLEKLDGVFASIDADFERLWGAGELPGWEAAPAADAQPALSTPDAVWCADCAKEFKNENVYRGHLSGRKHVRAAEQRATGTVSATRAKEHAVAWREYRVQRLARAMSTHKDDTRLNVERRQGMTERERLQELENLYAVQDEQRVVKRRRIGAIDGEEEEPKRAGDGDDKDKQDADDDDGDGGDKVYNPLKLPLAWDGKPIPFWLYRLHGLGVEFSCEICGQFTYMGRRAFEKHFNESRHIHGLRCLGITNTTLFRDITRIDEALRLWDKLQKQKKRSRADESGVVQMEDAEGHVMPEKVYYDLQKQGLV